MLQWRAADCCFMLANFVKFCSNLPNDVGTQVKPTLGQEKQIILGRSDAHRRGATGLWALSACAVNAINNREGEIESTNGNYRVA